MAYIVLARKYRPQTLDDVLGQEHITTALKNAILEDRIAQSFLFVGSRGVGKTSTARILAKILNCTQRAPESADPCNTCSSCVEITTGASLDVLEIDGASNRGIDEIRSLRENVKFKPATGAYKVYIIDEVHMLTQEAFNALLKTLEEPPPHVKFMFATTEPHRVLATIISRCQRYDFRRIPTTVIAAALKKIAKKEKIEISDDALFAVAKAAEGGMRDAQSILDQTANYSKGAITLATTEEMLGFTNEKTYIDLVRHIAERGAAHALSVIQQVVSEGKDLRDFNKGLLEILRDIMILQTSPASRTLIERLESSIEELKKVAGLFSIEDILYCLSVAQKLLGELRYSTYPQINTEVAIVKMTKRADMAAISELLAFLEKSDSSPTAAATPDRRPRAQVPEEKKKIISAEPDNNDARIREKMRDYLNTQEVSPQAGQQKATHPVPKETQPRKTGPCSFQDIEEKWQTVLVTVKKGRMSSGTFLSEAEPVELEGKTLILALPAEFTFHKEALEAKETLALVEKTLHEITGTQLRVKYVVAQKDGTEAVIKEKQQKEKHAQIIDSATEMFQGRIVKGS
jgi:DNA polymerase III subunit gamma/tau